jgi:hypothetical protein
MKLLNIFFVKKYWSVIILIALTACTKTDVLEINPQDSYKYYPIEVGDVKVYQVVTRTYAVGQKPKIDTLLRKEIVKSKIVDQSTTNFVIERQTKGKSDLFYKAELVFQVITNPKQIVIGERNVYTILLQFPLYKGAKWNINEINGGDENEAEIVKIDSIPSRILSYKNLVRVLSDSTNNKIDFKVNQYIFSKDFGIIYAEKTYIDYCQKPDSEDPNPITNCTGKYIIESGKREFITLLESSNINK